MKKITLLFVLTLLFKTISISAQGDSLEVWRYMHMVSPDELTRALDTRAFIETDPPAGPARCISEFEPQAAVLIRYPFGIPMSFIAKLAEKDTLITIVSNSSNENYVRNQYTAAGINLSKCKFFIANTDSYWTRDYGPMFTMDANYNIGTVDFIYNRPRPNDDDIARTIAGFLNMPFYGMRVVHTGGNYMCDGYGVAASTTIVYTESQQYGITNAQVNQRMLAYLGIDRHYVLQDPNNTYIDHIDCWGKFLAVDKILIRSVPTTHPRYAALEAMAQYWANQTSSWGNKYKVYRVNTPGNEPYTNSLILNKRVFVPQMNNGNDAAALTVYQNAMPGYEIIGVYGVYSYPWENTDALHCRTHEIADKGYLYISHIPDFEPHEFSNTYSLSTTIKALSGRGFYNDSLRLYYRINNGEWNYSILNSQKNNIFSGDISVPLNALKVDYYFHAADSSGRSQHYPIVGEYDPFTFEIINENSILTLSETEFVFDEPDIKILTVSNVFINTATIESVNSESLIYSEIMPYPESEIFEYPLSLNPDESIVFKIQPLLLEKKGLRNTDYNIDSLKITTPDSIYYVVIKCSKNFLEESISELTLSDTEFVFDEPDFKILTVSNFSINSATIESVNSESLIYSEVTPYPESEIFEYPLSLNPDESIAFKIQPLLLGNKGLRDTDYNIDSLKITTLDSIYYVVIKCNITFLEEHKSELTLSETEFVFDEYQVKTLTVSNLTDYDATIESLNNYDLWYSFVEPEPEIFEYPFILKPQENITLRIEPRAVIKEGLRFDDYNIDILEITTSDSIYCVVIKCNPDFMVEISEIENESIAIYPNPFDETVNIVCGVEKALLCTIFDNAGRVITKLYPTENNSFTWNSVNISKGVYLVQINTNKGAITKKVVKK